MTFTESAPRSGPRVFDNGISKHHDDVEAISLAVYAATQTTVDEDARHPNHTQYWSFSDRLLTLLGSKDEAIKFVQTVQVVFPGLFLNA